MIRALKLLSSFFLLSLLLLGPVWAQEEESTEGAGDWAAKLAGQEVAPRPKKVEDETLDAEGLSKNQRELIEIDKMIKSQGAQAVLTDPTIAKKMLKALSKGKGKNAKPMSPFTAVPEAEIEALIFKQSEGTPVHNFLKEHPKLITFLVRFMKSEDAFIGLIKIAAQDKKLKLYFGTFVLLTLLSFLFNMMGSRKSPFWKRFLRKIFISLFITCMQFVALYLFFGEELQPAIDIAKQVYHEPARTVSVTVPAVKK